MLSEAGLEQTQLTFHYTWVKGKTYRVSFESKSTNHVRHAAYLGEFCCCCVTDRPGRHWPANVEVRSIECPVHTPETSKTITEALKREARKLRWLSGSARELYLTQTSRGEPGYVQLTRASLMETMAAARERVSGTQRSEPEVKSVDGPAQCPHGSYNLAHCTRPNLVSPSVEQIVESDNQMCLDCGEHPEDQPCPRSRFSLLEVD